MAEAGVFVSYLFRSVPLYAGVLDLLDRQSVPVVNRSIPAWQPLDLSDDALARSLDMRIRVSTHLLVLATEALHTSPWCRREIEIARKYKKPIVAIFPPGQFGAPIPRVLDEGLYRAIGWRADALEKAIRGDYSPDARVFDISEEVARRQGIAALAAASAGAAVLFAWSLESEVAKLRAEIQAAGLALPEPPRTNLWPWVLAGAGLGFGGAVYLGAKALGLVGGAALGATVLGGVGAIVRARAELRTLGPLLEVRRLPDGALLTAA